MPSICHQGPSQGLHIGITRLATEHEAINHRLSASSVCNRTCVTCVGAGNTAGRIMGQRSRACSWFWCRFPTGSVEVCASG